jgi:hypothetical protein
MADSTLIVPDDVGRQTPMSRHFEALLLCPRPDLAAALSARRRPCGAATDSTLNPPSALDKGREPTAKVGCMFGAQIQLVGRVFDSKLDSLVGGSSGQVVLQLHLNPLHRPPTTNGPPGGWPLC